MLHTQKKHTSTHIVCVSVWVYTVDNKFTTLSIEKTTTEKSKENLYLS